MNPLNWIGDISNFFSGIVGDATKPITNWFASLAGQIASAIEAGFVSMLKDLWDVMLGPLLIFGGALVLIVGFVFAFKDQLMSLAPIAAMAAA